MKKTLFSLILFFLTISNLGAHTSHYKGIKVINMEVFRNENLIGYSNYFFTHGKNSLEVKNYTQFKVKLFNVIVFSVSSEALEKYKNDKLISYNSTTFQNDKEKYVKLKYDDSLKKFIINGSSYKGVAPKDFIVGTWWNHEIVKNSKQISPISGRINKQKVKFLGKKDILINGKNYNALHFHFLSDDDKPPKKKKLNMHVWYDSKKLLWIKASYDKIGRWEYRLMEVR